MYNNIVMRDAHIKMAWNWTKQNFSKAKVHLDLTEIQKNVDLISKIFFSIFQIVLIIIVGSYMVVLATFIWTEQDGITILPFDTIGVGGDCSGKAVADRLSMEMQRINNIHEFKQMLIDSKKNMIQKNETFNGTPFHSTPLIPSAFSKTQTLDKSLSQMGNIDVGPASVSLGQLLLMLRSRTGSSDKSITGSLEKYGSNISIVALMEDKNSSKGILAWEMTVPISEDKSLIEEKVPLLIKDLACNIVHDIGRKEGLEGVDTHKTWTVFKYLTEGWDAYRDYNITGNVSDLERSMDMTKKVIQLNPNSPELAQLLAIIQSAYQESGDGNEEELLDMATQVQDLSGNAWYSKGVLFFSRGLNIEASDAFDRATKIEPNNKLYWASKSFVLNKLKGKNDEALKAADVAIKLDPGYADAWHEKGIALYYLGEYDNSSVAHKKSIKLDSKKWWYYHDYALLLLIMGNRRNCDECYADAIESLDAALGFDLSDSDRKDIIALKEGILAKSQFSG